MFLDDDFSDQWILHHNARELSNVSCSGFVIFVRQSVRVCIVCRLESKCSSVTVHFLQEILHWLIRLHPSLIVISLVVATNGSLCIVGSSCSTLVLHVGTSSSRGLAVHCLTILVFGGNLEEVLAKVLCQHCGSVISTREH